MSNSTRSDVAECIIVGNYRLTRIASNTRFSTYEGNPLNDMARRIRAKGYEKSGRDPMVRQELSRSIKNQLKLKDIRAKLRLKIIARIEELREAQCRELGDPNAVVDMRELFSANPELVDDIFLHECYAHTRLLVDRTQTENRVFLIKDSIYSSLPLYLSTGRLDTEGALHYFYGLLCAVHYFHENGFAHRNISAEHIYITRDGAGLRLGGVFFCWNENASDAASEARAAGTDSQHRTPTPQPGSYGTCSRCGHPVPIVTEVPRSSSEASVGGANGGASDGTAVPPVSTMTTPCRFCGTMQNRLHLLQTIVGTPAFLPPEAITYQPLPSAMSTGSHASTSPGLGAAFGTGSDESSGGAGGRRGASGFTERQARDMWSCGVVLYYMVVGRLPFDTRDPASSVNQQGEYSLSMTTEQIWDMCNAIVSVRYKIPSYVGEDVRRIIESLLVRNPRQRLTVRELLASETFAKPRERTILSALFKAQHEQQHQ